MVKSIFKLKIVFALLSAILFQACSTDDDSYIEDQTIRDRKITITASVLTDANNTRAGIVEGNPNYTNGEEFYWTNGDAITLYFANENGTINSSSFTVQNSNGNQADFVGSIPQGLTDGNYTVYATKDLIRVAGTNQLKVTVPEIQTQNNTSSNGILIPMLSAPVSNVVVSGGSVLNQDILNFSLKQLNSLLRFTIENETGQNATIQSVSVYVENASGTTMKVFSSEGTISLGSALEWSNIATPTLDKQNLNISSGSVVQNGGKFDAYLSLLPTQGLGIENKFVIEIKLIGADGKRYTHRKSLPVSNTGSFSFLSSGMKAGLRYYFINDLTSSTIVPTIKTHTVTFEDATGSSYWSSLIDNPQYGGELLYGNYSWVDYAWTDQTSSLYSTVNEGAYGKLYWSGGIAVSNYYSSDSEANGSYEQQLTVYGTSGNNNSKNCAVVFAPGYINFTDGVAKTIDHMYIAPTTYCYYVALQGNEFSAPVASNESVWITATGYLNGIEGKTVTTYMIKDGESLVNSWTKWDLSELGKVDKVKLSMDGDPDNGFGFSIPAYFAIDDIMIEWDE